MSNNPAARKAKYDVLVQAKADALTSLTVDERASLRGEWNKLVSDVRASVAEDPASPVARSLAERWTSLLGLMTGKQLDASALHDVYRVQAWRPEMASYVDHDVWSYMARVFAAIVKNA